MSNKSEDRMDLGGFLQTYVLGNPFQSPLATTTTTTTENSVTTTPKSPPTVLSKQTKKKTPARTNTSQKKIPTPILVVPLGDTVNNTPPEQPGVEQLNGVDEKGTVQSSSELSEEPLVCAHVEASKSSLGHIGSNASYATFLRNRKVADIHRPIQLWLEQNFQHNPDIPNTVHCIYSNQQLLSDVQAEFPATTSIILSRIVKFTFPNCTKIINKTGTYWLGLIKKPEICRRAHVAAALVLKFNFNWEHALSSCDLQEATDASMVTSLLYWVDEFGEPIDLHRLADEGEHSEILMPLDLVNDTTSMNASLPKRQKRSPRFDKFSQDGPIEHIDDVNDEDYNPSQPTILSRNAGRKRKKAKPVKRNATRSPYDEENVINPSIIGQISSLIDQNGDIMESAMNASPERTSSRGHCESVSPIRSSRRLSANSSSKSNSQPDKALISGEHKLMEIKSEPVDSTEYSGKGAGNIASGDFIAHDENENCEYDIGADDAVSDVLRLGKLVSTTSPRNSKVLKENRHLKSNVKSLTAKLTVSENRIKKTLEELSKSQAEVNSLKTLIGEKDNQMFELVREFTDLNENFKSFGLKFQAVLLGSMCSNDIGDNESLLDEDA